MRPVNLADIEAAMRVLLAAAPAARAGVMAALIAQAETADRFRTSTGKRHVAFGCGSLLSAAASYRQAARPAQIDADALCALAIVIDGLARVCTDQKL